MYNSRLIPCLLLNREGLVKTVQFKHPQYLGDPLNAIKIFNEKEVDELIFLDIYCTKEKREPNYEYLAKIASQCFMPLCYGGGVTKIEQMKMIFSLGFEKIAINYSAYYTPELVRAAVDMFGAQSIVAAVDVGKNMLGQYTVKMIGGRKNISKNPIEYARYLEGLGVGEILVNDINNDGMMKGYNCQLIEKISSVVSVPVIACGGAGTIEDCKNVINAGASAAAAGSMFVYWGKQKAVLINYPTNFIISS